MKENYKLKMIVGKKVYYGKMILNIEGNTISGILESKDIVTNFENGKISDNKIEFSGSLKMFLIRIHYKAIGEINGNEIHINVNTNRGKFEITGVKEN